MFRNCVEAPNTGNCAVFDVNHQNAIINFSCDAVQEVDTSDHDDENFEVISLLPYYRENVIFYICGFVIKRIEEKVECNKYRKVLTADESDLSSQAHFTDFVSRGALIRPSYDAYRITKYIYGLIMSLSEKTTRVDEMFIINRTRVHFENTLFGSRLGSLLG